MGRAAAASLAIVTVCAGAARADCPAGVLAYGQPIPSFTAIAKRSLDPEWQNYIAQYPRMARLRSRYMPSAYRELGSIANQCLVEFTDNQSVAHKLVEFVVQASCNDITVGAIYHLLTIDICRDVLGREPDFYEFVGRRHVQVTTQTRYPDPPPNPNLEHVHKPVTYQPIGETRSPKNAGRLASASGPR